MALRSDHKIHGYSKRESRHIVVCQWPRKTFCTQVCLH